MDVNGWRLFQYPLFESQLQTLTDAVRQLSTDRPETYKQHPKTKLLAAIYGLIAEVIPRNPGAPEFRQGNTLGPDNRHWFRAKFHQRYRLFFRFSSRDKVIVYVWINDESTLRKAGSRSDAYAVFTSMLEGGNPPRSLEALLKYAKDLQLTGTRNKA